MAPSWAVGVLILSCAVAKTPQVRFQPEEYVGTGRLTRLNLVGLGTYTLQHKFGAWGEFLLDLSQRVNASQHQICLLDADGAELSQLPELETESTAWISAQPDASPVTQRYEFRLTVDAGLGYHMNLTVDLSERPVEVARRACGFQDVCHLRKVRLQQVESMCRRAMQRESKARSGQQQIRLFDLDKMLGSAPDGWHRNTTHMSSCLSCEMQNASKQLPPPHHLNPLELLVDDHIIQSRLGLERRWLTASKQDEPVLRRDKPWEDLAFGRYPSVLHNGTHFQMWYRAWFDGVAYAHSTDGLKWEKPELMIFDADQWLLSDSGYIDVSKARTQKLWEEEKQAAEAGHRFSVNHSFFEPKHRGHRNNIVSTPTQAYLGHQASVMTIDEHETNPAWRYKALHECDMQTCMSVSPDGFNWKPWREPNTPLTGRAADTYSQLLWCAPKPLPMLSSTRDGHKYLLHTRTDFGTDGGWREIRGHRTEIWGNESSQLLPDQSTFSVAREWYLDLEGKDERTRRHIYSLTSTVYAGDAINAPRRVRVKWHAGLHIGLLGVIQHPRDFSEGGIDFHRRHEKDARDVYVGINWDLSAIYAESPLIERGGDGSWDKDQIMGAPSIITWAGKHWIYYLGLNERHDCDSPDKRKGIGVATLEQDRIAGLCLTDGTNGTLTTVPFEMQSSHILVTEWHDVPADDISFLTWNNYSCLSWLRLRRNGMWVRDPEDSVCLHGPLDAKDAELKWHEDDTLGLPIGASMQLVLQLRGLDSCVFAIRMFNTTSN